MVFSVGSSLCGKRSPVFDHVNHASKPSKLCGQIVPIEESTTILLDSMG
jgi:hypothetical protein